MSDVLLDVQATTVSLSAVLDLAMDIWRIKRRATRDEGTPHAVMTACERATDTLHDLGIEIKELVGDRYDVNSRVQVVHEEGGPKDQIISECLSPAIYYQGQLIKRAEVVLKGEEENEQTNR